MFVCLSVANVNPTNCTRLFSPASAFSATRLLLDDAGCLGAPDWVIEITSPQTIKKDFNEKFNLYEQSGVRAYWLIVPKEGFVHVYTLEEEKYILVDIYESGDISSRIFPVLTIPHERIFG